MNTPIRFLIVSSLSVFLACSCLEGYGKEKEDQSPKTSHTRDEKIDQMPTFQGGDINSFTQWVASQVKYPKEALDKGLEGKVLVRFIVEKDGSLSDLQVIEGSEYLILDYEALRVIKQSPRWEPGIKDGKPVRVYFIVPIIFQLQ